MDVKKMTAVDIYSTVGNTSGTTITIREARFTVRGPSSRIGEAMLAGPVKIRRRSSGRIVLLFRLRAADPIAFVSILEGEDPSRLDGLTVSGTVTVRAGLARKKITVDEVPLSEFVANFDRITLPTETTGQ